MKPTMTSQILSELILNSAAARENSFDKEACEKAKEERGEEATHLEFNTFYRKTLREACDECCGGEELLAEPVFLLLYSSWNDTLDWARMVHEAGRGQSH